MMPWIRTRHWWVVLGTAAVCGLALSVLRARFVALPVLFGTDGMALWTTFLPLLWAVGVADCFSSKTQSAEIRPCRRAVALDACLLLAVAALGVAVFVAAAGRDQPTATTAGHVLAMTGLTTIVTIRGGAAAGVLASSALLMATTFYAADAPAGRYVRLLQPDGDPHWSLIAGLALCLVASADILAGVARVHAGAQAD